MKEIEELLEKIDLVLKKDLFSDSKTQKLFDYKQREKEYYFIEINSLLSKIGKEFPEKAKEIKKVLEKRDRESLLLAKELAKELLFSSEQKKPKFVLPKLPREIEEEIKQNFFELEKCFENSCYRSALILCGKILEIALHRKYFEVTSRDLLEKHPDIGLGTLVKKLKEKNIDLDPGLENQIHLINQLRIYSVHKKTKSFTPSREQTLATILYTLDTLKKLFDKNF